MTICGTTLGAAFFQRGVFQFCWVSGRAPRKKAEREESGELSAASCRRLDRREPGSGAHSDALPNSYVHLRFASRLHASRRAESFPKHHSVVWSLDFSVWAFLFSLEAQAVIFSLPVKLRCGSFTCCGTGCSAAIFSLPSSSSDSRQKVTRFTNRLQVNLVI